MRRAIFVVLAVMALVAAACSDPAPEPEPEPIPVTTLDPEPVPTTTLLVEESVGGVDLISEAELLYRTAGATARDMARLVAGMLTDPETGIVLCLDPAADQLWHDHREIKITTILDPEGGFQSCEDHLGGDEGSDAVIQHWTFGDSVYVEGKVEVTDCRKLPGGGTVTSGEYQDVTNDSDDPLTQNLEHKVTESKGTETSLNEDVDTTSETTGEVEGGVPFGGSAKVTQRVEAHFGLSKGSLDTTENTTEQTVSLEVTIEPGQVIGVTYTLDDSVTLCHSDIHSTVDWSSIDLRVWRHVCGDACDTGAYRELIDHGVISSHGRNFELSFDSVDDLVRLAAGTDPRCSGCVFQLGNRSDYGGPEAAYHRLASPESNRTVVYAGTRRTTTKDSASWIVKDITGADRDCVADVLGNDGTPVGDLDDKLADC